MAVITQEYANQLTVIDRRSHDERPRASRKETKRRSSRDERTYIAKLSARVIVSSVKLGKPASSPWNFLY